jgi:aspartate aminotransferase-like enzyme
MTHLKLFIPGPTEVHPDVLAAMARHPIGHRSGDFRELVAQVVKGIQAVLYTQNRIFLSTSSATGLMEAAVRNVPLKRVLSLVNGAFGERWHEIARACGVPADRLDVPWGQGIRPEAVDAALRRGDYDAVTLVHNETSTGVMNPLEGIAQVVKAHPDVALLVDTVSSMAGARVEVDRLGLDVCLASVQKCWGLPPGFALCAVSERAMERARKSERAGYYFSFKEFDKSYQKNETTVTPSIPHIYGLQAVLKRIFDEGLDARWARHAAMAERTRAWARGLGFAMFSEEGFHSHTVSCIANSREIDVKGLNGALKAQGLTISDGYGDLKNQTFRIAHMGEITLADLEDLFGRIEAFVGGAK